MAEIIDLISSSPPQAKVRSSLGTAHSLSLKDDILEFDWDQFKSTADLAFEVDQPFKKRKLGVSPSSVLEPVLKARVRDTAFDLSSEDELLPSTTEIPHARSNLAICDENANSERFGDAHISSSAPELGRGLSVDKKVIFELSSDPEVNIDNEPKPSRSADDSIPPVISTQTATLLAKLNGIVGGDSTRGELQKRRADIKSKRSVSHDSQINNMQRFKKVTKSSTTQNDDIVDSSQSDATKSRLKKAAISTDDDSQSQKIRNKLPKEEREAAKEAEKERKRKEKEEKAQEKQKAADIAEVNKSKTNKKNSTSEMILDMPETLRGRSVCNQVEEYMKQLDVKVTFSEDEEVDVTSESEVTFGNIVRWRRRVTADYDEDLEIWKPLPQSQVSRENHVLVYLKAEELVKIAVIGRSLCAVKSASDVSESTMNANLDEHVNRLRARCPNCSIIYLIEGLSAWNRKSQTAKNRAYTTAVRSQVLEDDNDQDEGPSSYTQSQRHPQPRSRTKPTTKNQNRHKQTTPQLDLTSITTDTTDRFLLHLQLHHQPLLIHHTTSPATTASQISTLTQHLSTRPYRLAEQTHNLTSASFCMTTGQIRTGATPHETYINMLQEINRVTPSMAYGISNAGYANVNELTKGFTRDGNLMLEDVRKSVNKDGGWSDRRLGPMVSKRLYRVFMGKDPDARDGIA